MIEKYNPEEWLESTIRCIREFTEIRLTELIGGDDWSNIYDVVMEFPGPMLDDRTRKVPLTKQLVHFEVDGITERTLGFGNNVFEDNYDAATGIYPQEAGISLINFDVGIWTSDRVGGTSARAETRRMLSQIFNGPAALERFRTDSDGGDGGIEIVRYTGGRFATDKVNDVIVYRTVDGQLEVKVFSRTPKPTDAVPTIEQIGQSQGLTILG